MCLRISLFIQGLSLNLFKNSFLGIASLAVSISILVTLLLISFISDKFCMKDQLTFLSFVFIASMSASSYFQIVFFCDWMRYVLNAISAVTVQWSL